MDRVLQFYKLVHVVGFIFWVGPLIGAARLLQLAAQEGQASGSARLAQVARQTARLADVGSALAIAGGLLLMSRLGFSVVLKQPYMHIKLTLVVFLIGLHGYVRARGSKAMTARTPFPAWPLAALVLGVLGILTVIIFKVPLKSS
jgi:putative membrane protein